MDYLNMTDAQIDALEPGKVEEVFTATSKALNEAMENAVSTPEEELKKRLDAVLLASVGLRRRHRRR